MARNFDARRFSGPIGEMIAKSQARVLANMVGRIKDREVLDVGTGTGRAALILALGGAKVTAVDASEEMLAIARQRAAEQMLTTIKFQRADAHALDFVDRSFDAVVSFRLLMHVPQWKRCVAELCRVAGRLVIVDYPSATSVALIESLTRRAMHSAGMKTEPYRVFTRHAIEEAFDRNGFRIRSVHRQFVLPISLLPTYSKYPGDYRTVDQILRDRNASLSAGPGITHDPRYRHRRGVRKAPRAIRRTSRKYVARGK
jgi:SAM-dependent methyltransferase